MKVNKGMMQFCLILPLLTACDSELIANVKGVAGKEQYLEYIDEAKNKPLWLRTVPMQWDFHPDLNDLKLKEGRLPDKVYRCLSKAKTNLQKKSNKMNIYYLTYDDQVYIQLIVDKREIITKASLVKGTKIVSNMFHVPCSININEFLVK